MYATPLGQQQFLPITRVTCAAYNTHLQQLETGYASKGYMDTAARTYGSDTQPAHAPQLSFQRSKYASGDW